MRILLTGATGFVGRNALLRAVQRGWTVLAPVRNASRLQEQLTAEGVEDSLVQALPANPAAWPPLQGIGAAIHCAGALFERSLEAYLQTNLTWTQAILRAIPRGCPTVVLSSQSAGGPTPPGQEARRETDADDPVSNYGESKLRMERSLLRRPPPRLAILRPPMILGPRDKAIQQLFAAARGGIRLKPGMRSKDFSFIACEDLLDAVDATLEKMDSLAPGPHYIAAKEPITDYSLLEAAALCVGARGISLPIPQGLVRAASFCIDHSPSLRAKLPSMTRDRVREMLEDRWVVDASQFQTATGWSAKSTLETALREAGRDPNYE